jgi:hypothetical protein
MADEPQSTETEQADSNPATENQPPASVVTVYDGDGREHFAAPTSKWVVDGLADGTLTEELPAKSPEEVPSGTETGSASHDPEPGPGDGGDGSGDGETEAGGAGRRRRSGTA